MLMYKMISEYAVDDIVLLNGIAHGILFIHLEKFPSFASAHQLTIVSKGFQ